MPLPRSLFVVIGIAAGFVLGALMLLLSAHSAGAAVLSDLLPPPATQVLSPVTTTVSDVTGSIGGAVGSTVASTVQGGPVAGASTLLGSALPAVSTTATSAPAGLLKGTTGAITSSSTGLLGTITSTAKTLPTTLGGSTGPIGLAPASRITALPVHSSPAFAAPGGVVSQGPQTTPNMSSGPLSATTLDVVHRAGSAALFAPSTPEVASQTFGHLSPIDPRPTHRLPATPINPLAAMGSSSGSGAHGIALDSLPPAILVLALLAGAALGLERRRRPATRFDLRFSPPG